MSDLQPTTILTAGDEIQARLRVIDVKPSDHKYYGFHDLITFELIDGPGDLPAGLRLQVRRPHDGGVTLRRPDAESPQPDDSMAKTELLAIASRRGIEVPPKATKREILAVLL